MAKGFYVGINNVARKIKEGYVGVGGFTPRELPDGYTQVEYIQSSGTQYIDTGFKPNQDTRVVMDIQLTSNSGIASLFGARTSASEQTYQFVLTNTGVFRSDYNNAYTQTWDAEITNRYLVDKNGETTTFNGSSQSYENIAFQAPVNMILFGLNNNGTCQWFASALLYSCQIYDNGIIIRDYVPCTNSSGTAGLYDLINNVFYVNAGTGTFSVGSSNPNSAVARRIKEAFIGIGGVARPCWYEGTLAYYGAITDLSVARQYLAATHVGNYALFAGGTNYYSSYYYSTVDAYDKSLTHTTPTSLSVSRYRLAAATVGEYALFGGGLAGSDATGASSVVDAYDTSLTRTTATSLNLARYNFAATSMRDYALFGGESSLVDAYDKSLTHTTVEISTYRWNLGAASVGDYALFAGGYGYSTGDTNSTRVDVYDKSLTHTMGIGLSLGRCNLSGSNVGNYALFAGGAQYNSSTFYNTVDAYDTSLTHTIATSLSEAYFDLAATNVGDFALFGGVGGDVVDVYNTSLTHTTATPLDPERYKLAATTVNNYALFGGGSNYSTVEAYVVA